MLGEIPIGQPSNAALPPLLIELRPLRSLLECLHGRPALTPPPFPVQPADADDRRDIPLPCLYVVATHRGIFSCGSALVDLVVLFSDWHDLRFRDWDFMGAPFRGAIIGLIVWLVCWVAVCVTVAELR